MSFDVMHRRGLDPIKIRKCPVLRYTSPLGMVDIVKSSTGEFWYAMSPQRNLWHAPKGDKRPCHHCRKTTVSTASIGGGICCQDCMFIRQFPC